MYHIRGDFTICDSDLAVCVSCLNYLQRRHKLLSNEKKLKFERQKKERRKEGKV